MAENLAQFLGDVSPIGPTGAPPRAGLDDCGGSELSFRPDARGADASSRPPLGQRAESNTTSFTFGGKPTEPADSKPRFEFSFGATTGTAAGAGGADANANVTKPRRTLAPVSSARYGAGLSSGAADDAAADAVPPPGGSLLRSSTAGGLPPATLRSTATTNTAAAGSGGGFTFGGGGASKPSTLGTSSYGQQQQQQHRSTISSYGSTSAAAAAAATQQQQARATANTAAATATTTTMTTAGLQSLQQRAAAVGVTQTTGSTAYGQRSSLFSRPSAASQQPVATTPPNAAARAAPAAAPAAAAASPAPSSPRTATPRPLVPTGTYLDVLTWRDSGRTGAHFAAGLVALALAGAAAYYPHGVSALTAVACLALFDLALNFVRFFTPFSDRSRLLWSGSSALGELASAAASLVRSLGSAHDRWLSASDPSATLKAALALWLAAWVGTLGLPPLALALASWVALFTLPWAWMTQGRRARALRRAALRTPVVGPLVACAEAAAQCAGSMPRVSRLAGTLGGVAGVALWTRSWVQVGASVFVCLCHWRTALAPAEIESIRSAAEPWTQSVRKMGKRLSSAMEDAFAGGGGAGAGAAAYGGTRVGGVGNGGSLAARVAAGGRSYY